MKGLILAAILMVVGAQAYAESKSHSLNDGTKAIREYK